MADLEQNVTEAMAEAVLDEFHRHGATSGPRDLLVTRMKRALEAALRQSPSAAPVAVKVERLPAANIALEIAAKYLSGGPGIRLAKEIAGAIRAERTRIATLEVALRPFADIADLVDSETEGLSDTDEFQLLFHDYLLASWRLSLFRTARAALTSQPDAPVDVTPTGAAGLFVYSYLVERDEALGTVTDEDERQESAREIVAGVQARSAPVDEAELIELVEDGVRARLGASVDVAEECARNRLEPAMEFVARMCWRTDPSNANNVFTDEQRFSAIKHHPTVKEYGKPHIDLAERERARFGKGRT